jgi:hypothetical protein
LPTLIYGLWVWFDAGTAILFDLRYTAARLGGATIAEQMQTLAHNLSVLLFQDVWFVLALIGLWRLRLSRGLSLAFLLLPVLVLGRTEALHHLSEYYLIPVYPFVALGLGQFAGDAAAYLNRWATQRLRRPVALRHAAAAAAIGLFLLFPAILLVRAGWSQATSGWETALEPFLVPGREARMAALYVSSQANPEDVTLASPAVAWLIDGPSADFQMAVAAAGVATPHLPADIPLSRWRFDPRLDNARFVVVDALWTRWAAVHVPGVDEMLREISEWDVGLDTGRIQVFMRPESP